MNEDIRNDFLLFKKLKDNPVHSCVDLSKRMIGTRDGFVYFTQNFRIDFENKMSSLAAKDTEINKLNNVIDRMAEVLEECRQNDCLYSDDIDLSEIAGSQAIKEYFMKENKNG